MNRLWCVAIIVCLAAGVRTTSASSAARVETLVIRGHAQTLRLYGPPGGAPIIVSSGDGGWMHLGPQIAETLADAGYFVVGFDARAYLESFTFGRSTLEEKDEPSDYAALVDVVARKSGKKPVLIGVSEGAGLSVLAATDPGVQRRIRGVIGVGLPELTELGWRWKDAIIYVTHRVPNEPTFSTAAVVPAVAPVPLALIHSTGDEFAPLADADRVLAAAREPKRLWVVTASNHRFSDNRPALNRSLFEAIAWIGEHSAP